MLQTEQRPLTAADFRTLPEGPPYYQLIHGELIMSPSPNRYHQRIVQNIEFILLKYLEQHPVGEVYAGPLDCYLTDADVFQPDLLYVSKANAHILTDYVEGAPDLVIEILSPSTGRYDRDDKRKVYAQTGVKELWLVFPKAQKVERFDLRQDAENPANVCGHGESFASPLFPSLVVQVGDILKR